MRYIFTWTAFLIIILGFLSVILELVNKEKRSNEITSNYYKGNQNLEISNIDCMPHLSNSKLTCKNSRFDSVLVQDQKEFLYKVFEIDNHSVDDDAFANIYRNANPRNLAYFERKIIRTDYINSPIFFVSTNSFSEEYFSYLKITSEIENHLDGYLMSKSLFYDLKCYKGILSERFTNLIENNLGFNISLAKINKFDNAISDIIRNNKFKMLDMATQTFLINIQNFLIDTEKRCDCAEKMLGKSYKCKNLHLQARSCCISDANLPDKMQINPQNINSNASKTCRIIYIFCNEILTNI
ncbi:hypothetical protein EDEG_02882 [Edhazardia aedis USNM 41457]|uniref:Uncharacterized protein n=1 Tax=Edhazardia aedis (strain USNM 41457) TaxID=1003232 RepID=J8ZSQ9_EDHAE|nr:hypothetical protein EDEG_02882 [Edhazardia aedis USNM 41457]|eukprot:EJW02698.1 hypothetical protein EDEG_02882 [Edhazardia aedis USNM 41457]